MIELTTVVGVDARTLEQLRLSLPTWARYRRELFRQPWLIFYDARQVHPAKIADVFPAGDRPRDVRALQWPSSELTEYHSQRERMLSGFVHAARYVQTPWWVKIDTDAVALRESDWAPADWFERPEPPVWVASPWGYTKPADQMARLDDWADGVPQLREHARLDLPYEDGARRCRHKRMASWVSFYRSDWTRWASDLARHYCGLDRIPVPSQDGYHFYLAARTKAPTLRAQMKRRGWTNCPRLEGLRATATAALRGEFEP